MNTIDLTQAAVWLPLFFFVAMGIAMLSYVVLDGYDLGIGMLLNRGTDAEKDMMIASIGPFWDANETWIVLGVGLLLVAFPLAHGVILTELYLPVAAMLLGLILRGVSFDFRVKVNIEQKPLWNLLFYIGSLVASVSQGIMIGRLIVGFDSGLLGWLFSVLVGLCLPAGYVLLGSTWLILKTEGDLQKKAFRWAKISLWLTGFGIALVSIATPYFSPEIMHKWFAWPQIIWLSPVPIATGVFFLLTYRFIDALEEGKSKKEWLPFASVVAIFWLSFFGIAFSIFPYVIIGKMTLWQAAAATESLWVIFWGAIVVLPTILGYTLFSYRIFKGKATALTYY
jgi:cytochrome d ubiquinol oxidase subunit II